MRHRYILSLILIASATACSEPAQQPVVVDPNAVQLSPYRHAELSPAFLARVRATTDMFETIDGITYEQAVDLYKRDLDPEENIVLWEEMARAYGLFCRDRCTTPAERMDVYRLLLLRTMVPGEQALARAEPKVLSRAEAEVVLNLYSLPPKPVEVIEGS